MKPQTTWQEFKANVEQLGVKDNDLIRSIDVANPDPRCLEVTQLTDVDPGSNVYIITSADQPIEAP